MAAANTEAARRHLFRTASDRVHARRAAATIGPARTVSGINMKLSNPGKPHSRRRQKVAARVAQGIPGNQRSISG